MSDRRGSLTTPARKGSKSRRNTASCSCSGPPPRSGPPEVIRRVGSPPVWESMMVKVFMMRMVDETDGSVLHDVADFRSEEHTSELQSLMRISYAVFCLKKNRDYRQRLNTR